MCQLLLYSSPRTSLSTDTSIPTENALRQSRSRLRLARTTAQDAYTRYRQASDQVQIFEAEVARAEERFDELGRYNFPRNSSLFLSFVCFFRHVNERNSAQSTSYNDK